MSATAVDSQLQTWSDDAPGMLAREDTLSIESKIGSGGFGSVFKGKLNDQVVAVKIVPVDRSGKDQGFSHLQHMFEEVRVLQAISHRNIVEFKGARHLKPSNPELPPECLALVQEFIPGGPLSHVVCRQMANPNSKTYKTQDALAWALDLATALLYLHSQSPPFVHRDVKLSNVLLGGKYLGRRTAKLSDFGLCKRLNDENNLLLRSSSIGPLSSRHRQVFFSPSSAEVSAAVSSRLKPGDRASFQESRVGSISGPSPFIGNEPQDVRDGSDSDSSAHGNVRSRPAGGANGEASGNGHLNGLAGAPFMYDPEASMDSMDSNLSWSTTLGCGDIPEVLTDALSVVYNRTGNTGSHIYMAPEVFRGEPYNTKVDVFSFGVVLYELMARTMLAFTESRGGTSEEHLVQYAGDVAGGYRPAKPKTCPPPVWELIHRCWRQDPLDRPEMDEVVQELEELCVLAERGMLEQKRNRSRSDNSAASLATSSRAPSIAEESDHNSIGTIGLPGDQDISGAEPAASGCKCVIS